MTTQIDLLIDPIGQLCTIPPHDSGPQRGHQLGDLGIIENAAVAISNGRIVAAGRRQDIVQEYVPNRRISAAHRVVTPGLIDPHTHAIWSGDRAEEFEMRLKGATYQDIMAAGGGINRTMRKTRSASLLTLVEEAKKRLDQMIEHGTTSVEIKTGYGLDTKSELNLLNAMALLDVEHPIEIVPTFMGAHAVPPEFADNAEGYVDLILDKMLPEVAAWREQHWPGALYCDVFCEEGAFSVEQSRVILQAAQRVGLKLRLHVDEFASLGGIPLAVELGATSVDHLLVTTPDDARLLGESDTIAVLLPATPFGLGIPNTAPVGALLESNAIIALATDCNPGTAWCENMQMVLALASRALRLTPAQALAAATVNGAFAIDRGADLGSIEVGRQADLVVWSVPDYRHLGYRFGVNLARTVIKKGDVVFERREE